MLVLHGGRERGFNRARANQLAVLRMVPIARAITQGAGRHLVVARLQNRVRGWNRPQLPAVEDAQWAIAQLRNRFGPDLPIALVGHSMGGRTAMRVAGTEGIRTIVGLAPWLPSGEPTGQLAGRRVLIVHGAQDRMTDPIESHKFAQSLQGVATQVSFVEVTGERHALLRRRAVVDALTAGFVQATLLDTGAHTAPESESGSVANLLQRVLAGQARVVA